MKPLSVLLLECLPHISMLVLLGFFLYIFSKTDAKYQKTKTCSLVFVIWGICVWSCGVSSRLVFSSASTDVCFSLQTRAVQAFCDHEEASIVFWVPEFHPNSTGKFLLNKSGGRTSPCSAVLGEEWHFRKAYKHEYSNQYAQSAAHKFTHTAKG